MLGTAKRRLKRQFGHAEEDLNNHTSVNRVEDEEVLRDAEDLQEKSGSESEGDSGADDNDRVQPFTRIARDLEAAAGADSDDEDSGEVVDAPSSAAPTQSVCPF
jgi:hypothetical protein